MRASAISVFLLAGNTWGVGASLRALPADTLQFWPAAPRVLPAAESVALRVRLVDDSGQPRNGVAMDLVASDPTVRVQGGQATTGPTGIAEFANLRLVGPPADFDLTVSVLGGPSLKAAVRLAVGPPRAVLIRTQPPGTFRPDTAFTQAPVIEVQDGAGNPVPAAQVRASVHFVRVVPRHDTAGINGTNSRKREKRETAMRKEAGWQAGFPATVTGAGTVSTGTNGQATFTGLGITARQGVYRLVFAAGTVEDTSMVTTYDADYAYRRNFIEIGAIRSLAGVKPSDEFFAIRSRFRFNSRIFATVESDIALTKREDKDSVRSTQRNLTEAEASINFAFYHVKDPATSIPERGLAFGLFGQIFNTVPYAGIHFTSVELKNSVLEGSSMSVGYATSLYTTPIVVEGETVRPQPHNLLINTYVRSGSVDFFKVLTIRGSFLIPLRQGQPVASRIAIVVPVQTIRWF